MWIAVVVYNQALYYPHLQEITIDYLHFVVLYVLAAPFVLTLEDGPAAWLTSFKRFYKWGVYLIFLFVGIGVLAMLYAMYTGRF